MFTLAGQAHRRLSAVSAFWKRRPAIIVLRHAARSTTQRPPPALPISVIEQVLAITPNIHTQLVQRRHNGISSLVTRFTSRTTPLNQQELVALLRVLPHRLVPQAVQSVLVQCSGPTFDRSHKSDLVLALINWLAKQMPIDRGDDLHLAARFYSGRIVKPLLGRGEGLFFELRVAEAAFASGNIDFLNWLKLAGLDFDSVSPEALAAAAANGHVALRDWIEWPSTVLEWFHNHVDDADAWGSFRYDVVSSACESGHVDIPNWLMEAFGPHQQPGFNWSMVWHSASRGGHVRILQWASKARILLPQQDTSGSCVDASAEHGHGAVLDWWIMNQGAMTYTWWSKCAAYKCFVCGKPTDIDNNRNGMYDERLAGSLDILEVHGVFEDLSQEQVDDIIEQAIQYGKLEAVEWWECYLADHLM
ncbi:hypothetical protein BCR44DRAFT_73274 [Catenaria anguillulae PL171]|uniref:Ankyrin repeat-containing domain protein n=1 Tax=Catenaria anguillulae PL171 TaxID=765915 RepID=A0A1Y2HTK0_9FUNG|nr:hypothetical protein BCR44DRAFT_73274 [Catenaria anguillulae PL171]